MTKLLYLLLFVSLLGKAQNLTPQEQRKLLEDVESMKEKIIKLESQAPAQTPTNSPTGLKKINYQHQTSQDHGSQNTHDDNGQPGLDPIQAKALEDQLQILKKNQEESEKIMKQLESEE